MGQEQAKSMTCPVCSLPFQTRRGTFFRHLTGTHHWSSEQYYALMGPKKVRGKRVRASGEFVTLRVIQAGVNAKAMVTGQLQELYSGWDRKDIMHEVIQHLLDDPPVPLEDNPGRRPLQLKLYASDFNKLQDLATATQMALGTLLLVGVRRFLSSRVLDKQKNQAESS